MQKGLNSSVLLFSSLLFLPSVHAAELIDLVVQSGEKKEITARTLQYKNVYVKPGGVLKVRDRSSRWCILWTAGEVVIDGTLEFTSFSDLSATVSDRTPDGKDITHTFERAALGGAGGRGGIATLAGAGSRNGGQGAIGTNKHGGGGGSGGGIHIMGSATKLGSHGVNAADWRGAPAAADGGYTGHGGNGGRPDNYSNGGLLFVYAPKGFSGQGVIKITGKNGTDGAKGGDGTDSNRGRRGAGGGGGGAPGGDGGRLVVVADEYKSEPRYETGGGKGGRGGKTGGFPNGASNGEDGDTGGEGFIDLLTVDQWNGLRGFVGSVRKQGAD